MKTITKFVANDGSEWKSESGAIQRDALIIAVNEAMRPLEMSEAYRKAIEAGDGWYQHDLLSVHSAREAILALARPIYAQHYPAFNTHGSEVHPLSIIGRILDDGDRNPISDAWRRFANIDETGREFQQCYYAYGAGRGSSHAGKQLNPIV